MIKKTAEDPLMTSGEVAALFRVDPKTVARWAAAGRIGSIRTPGGHRRYRESEVKALLEGGAEAEGDIPGFVQVRRSADPNDVHLVLSKLPEAPR